MQDELIIGTGHRPDKLGGLWEPSSWMPAVVYLKEAIAAMSAFADGKLAVVSGMADGFDLMLAAGALMAKDDGVSIRLIAAIPFEGQEAAFKSTGARKWWARARERADEVHVISKNRGDYKSRNQWMVDQPAARGTHGMIWACWDGLPGRGTSQTVRMAKDRGLNIDDSFWRIVREELGLVDRMKMER